MTYLDTFRRVRAAVAALLADKEDTKQVFIILEALSGGSRRRVFRRFKRLPIARKVFGAERELIAYLRDRDWLNAQPEGSLARAYADFTEREQITADGLAQASTDGYTSDYEAGWSPDARRLNDRQRDAHDLWHVVTGYGRDGVGELALLAFTWRQVGNFGIWVIIGFGWRETAKTEPELKLGVILREALRRAKHAAWLPAADWETLLTQPLDEVRRQLGVALGPTIYTETMAAYPPEPAVPLAAE